MRARLAAAGLAFAALAALAAAPAASATECQTFMTAFGQADRSGGLVVAVGSAGDGASDAAVGPWDMAAGALGSPSRPLGKGTFAHDGEGRHAAGGALKRGGEGGELVRTADEPGAGDAVQHRLHDGPPGAAWPVSP